MERKNKNRGYQRLRVWQDAVTLYVETCRLFKSCPFEMKRVTGQAIASADLDRNTEHQRVECHLHRQQLRSLTNPQHSNTPVLQRSSAPFAHCTSTTIDLGWTS